MTSNSDSKSINYTKVVDLSHVIDPSIPTWPNDPPVEFESVAELENDGYYLRRFSIGEHSGTHLNAPNSFYGDGASIDTYPASSLVVSAVVIDVQKQAAANADYVLTKSDVLSWEQQHQRIPADSMVLLYTGWQAKWQNPNEFLNQDAQGGLHFPGFAGDTTQFLLEERGIAGVGIDTHGVDPGQNESFATNKQVLEKSKIVLENLTNLDQLPPLGTTLVMGILRLKGGSGTPVSVLAFVP
jgi:kynurenine formamidase